MEIQSITLHYIKRAAIQRILSNLFGENYEIDVQTPKVILSVPRKLTEVPSTLLFTYHLETNKSRLKLVKYVKNLRNKVVIMESLLDKINILRSETKNYHQISFIPSNEFRKIITSSAVKRVLEESKVEKYNIEEATQYILDKHLKVFTILLRIGHVESISSFIKDDHFEPGRTQDQRLPFSEEYLLTFLQDNIAKKFHNEQWEYTVPIFLRSSFARSLNIRSILPILNEKRRGKGAFGEVYEITLHNAHHSFSDRTDKFIRKDFCRGSEQENSCDFERELENLAILNSLKHPCIIELMVAYRLGDTYSLIFPSLDMDLGKFLSETRPDLFNLDASIFIALARLSRGIEHIHNYVVDQINLELIGCHHDLKPDNILIDNGGFVLADFGLSTFRDVTQGSQTTIKHGETDYQAPECDTMEGKKRRTGRKSDIWSYGCIIAEVLAYIIQGPSGVKDFQNQRRFKDGRFILSSFWCGNKPNPGVIRWLSTQESESKSQLMLIDLIRSMLQIDPDIRPDAKNVALTLEQIALMEVFSLIDTIFETLRHNILEEDDTAKIFLENARYISWKKTCSLRNDATFNIFKDFPLISFDLYIDLLLQFHAALEETLKKLPKRGSIHLFLPIRHLNNQLEQLLPPEFQRELQMRLVENAITKTQDQKTLEIVQQALESDSDFPIISARKLAGIKLMTKVIEESWERETTAQGLEIESEYVACDTSIAGLHTIGQIKQPSQDTGREVFIEWLYYDSKIVLTKEGEERAKRVIAVAELFNRIEHPPGFCVLRCSGFFHDSEKNRFGLAFDFPFAESTSLAETEDKIKVITLAELLQKSRKDRRIERPSLGARFLLASNLALSIWEFHQVGWLHRNLIPQNIVFFHTDGSTPSSLIQNPYLVGFSHSRPNRPNEFTQGPNNKDIDYQHPEYIQTPQRYQIHFDYYSFGILLFTIFYWKPLSVISKEERWEILSPVEFRNALIKQARSNRLAHGIGTRCANAIEFCLTGSDELSGEVASHQLQEMFKRIVVDELANCVA